MFAATVYYGVFLPRTLLARYLAQKWLLMAPIRLPRPPPPPFSTLRIDVQSFYDAFVISLFPLLFSLLFISTFFSVQFLFYSFFPHLVFNAAVRPF